MKHITPQETNEMLKRLQKGEKVTCPFCEKGEFVSKADPKVSHGFKCNNCGTRWNIN